MPIAYQKAWRSQVVSLALLARAGSALVAVTIVVGHLTAAAEALQVRPTDSTNSLAPAPAMQCDWTDLALSEDGRYVAGIAGAASYHASTYRPLNVWICETGSQSCRVRRGLGRPDTISATNGGFRVGALNGAVGRISFDDAREIQFSEPVAPEDLSGIALPYDTANARRSSHRPGRVTGVDGSSWVRSIYPEPFVYPVHEDGQLGDGGWPIYIGPDRRLAGVFDHQGITWLELAPITADQATWLAEIWDRHPGALVRAITMTSDGRVAAYSVSGVSSGGEIRVRDDRSSDVWNVTCSSEYDAVVELAYNVQLGSEERPLQATRFDPSNSPDGVVVWFIGGPRNSIYHASRLQPAHAFLRRNLSILMVDYSGSHSPIRAVDQRLAEDTYLAVRNDWAAVDAYLRRTSPDCEANILAANSFGGTFFQAMVERGDSCIGGAFLAAPWLQYRDPAKVMDSRAFGGRDRTVALEWERATFGEQIHDPGSSLRQLQSINNTNCRFEGYIFAIFAPADSISQPEDLGNCRDRARTRITVREAPYLSHDLIFTQADQILEEAARFLVME